MEWIEVRSKEGPWLHKILSQHILDEFIFQQSPESLKATSVVKKKVKVSQPLLDKPENPRLRRAKKFFGVKYTDRDSDAQRLYFLRILLPS